MKQAFFNPITMDGIYSFYRDLRRHEEELKKQRETLKQIAQMTRQAKETAAILAEHNPLVIVIISEFLDTLIFRTSEEIRALRKKKKQLRRLYFKLFHRNCFSYLITPLLLLFYEYVDIRTTHKEAKEMHTLISFIQAVSSHKPSLSYEINREFINNAHAA